MFPGFSELDLPVLAKVLRRTVVSAIIVGAGAIIVSLLLAPALAAVGEGHPQGRGGFDGAGEAKELVFDLFERCV